jgi:hypothetical protein
MCVLLVIIFYSPIILSETCVGRDCASLICSRAGTYLRRYPPESKTYPAFSNSCGRVGMKDVTAVVAGGRNCSGEDSDDSIVEAG